MKRKISNKDKKDWQNFINSKEKLENKEKKDKNMLVDNIDISIDLHGYTLDEANAKIYQFIENCFSRGVNKINIITGKGLRSKNIEDPYKSNNLSILKHTVPDFIKSKPNLIKIIKNIEEAKIEDGGGGAFYVFLKKFK